MPSFRSADPIANDDTLHDRSPVDAAPCAIGWRPLKPGRMSGGCGVFRNEWAMGRCIITKELVGLGRPAGAGVIEGACHAGHGLAFGCIEKWLAGAHLGGGWMVQ